jgi:hypothetical protein
MENKKVKQVLFRVGISGKGETIRIYGKDAGG